MPSLVRARSPIFVIYHVCVLKTVGTSRCPRQVVCVPRAPAWTLQHSWNVLQPPLPGTAQHKCHISALLLLCAGDRCRDREAAFRVKDVGSKMYDVPQQVIVDFFLWETYFII